MTPTNTRRFEMGLPLFSGLDLGAISKAQAQIAGGDVDGLTAFVGIMAKAATANTIRKLAAIWKASDLELKLAEGDASVMAALEALAADRAFAETFADAMSFQSALWASLGVIPDSSAPVEQKASATGEQEAAQDGSPSES